MVVGHSHRFASGRSTALRVECDRGDSCLTDRMSSGRPNKSCGRASFGQRFPPHPTASHRMSSPITRTENNLQTCGEIWQKTWVSSDSAGIPPDSLSIRFARTHRGAGITAPVTMSIACLTLIDYDWRLVRLAKTRRLCHRR